MKQSMKEVFRLKSGFGLKLGTSTQVQLGPVQAGYGSEF